MRNRTVALGLVAVLVVVGLLVGLLLLLERGDDVALPDRLGDYVALDSAAYYADAGDDVDVDSAIGKQREALETSSDQVSDVLGGAAVGTRRYGPSDRGTRIVTVLVAEADLGPLLPEYGFDDPELTGSAAPLVEATHHGDVDCLLHRVSPPRADDDDPDPEDLQPDSVTCQRTSGSLGVRVTMGPDADEDETVELVEDVWDDVS